MPRLTDDPALPQLESASQQRRHTTGFRADVNGLRAVAVLLVTAFHYAVPGFGSGFIGVDIFFVISGYLIARILISSAGQERGSWWRFYRARLTRIYPPMVVVAGVLLALGYFFLEPASYLRLARHALYSIGGVVNYRFYTEADYFAPERASIWLLHLWSVSVELQFYLIAPLLFWWTRRRGRGWTTGTLLTIAALSFAAGVYAGRHDTSAAFYFTPIRLWEFAVGALAFQFGGRIPTGSRPYAALLGLGLIAAALPVLTFVSLSQTANDLLPVVGTALVLAAGTRSWVLTNPVSQFVGAISYSVYLWHWPVWVAARQYGRASTPLETLTLAAMTLVLATLSRTLIERPFHASRERQVPRWRSFAAAAAVGAIAAAAGAVVLEAGFPSRVPALVADVGQAATTVESIRQDRCFLSPPDGAEKLAAECFAETGDDEVLLMGDSHAVHLWPGFSATPALHAFRLSQVTAGACPPLMLPPPKTAPTSEPGAAQFDSQTGIVIQCSGIMQRAFDYIARIRPSLVVLAARWTWYDTHGVDLALELHRVVDALRPLGVRALIVGPIPEWTPALPQKLLDETFKRGGAFPLRMRDSSHLGLEELDRRLHAISQELGVSYLSLRDLLCTADGCLTEVTAGGREALVSWDSAHLTIPGSEWIVEHGVAQAVVTAMGSTDDRALARKRSNTID